MKLLVPTYRRNTSRQTSEANVRTSTGTSDPASVANLSDSDFGPPCVPVVVHQAEGVRIVLGTHEWQSSEFPDIQVERRPSGWAIFLHPVGGCDPSALVYILDDGRSFIEKGRFLGPTPAIEILGRDGVLPELEVR